ncbi:MAG: hypothetical protein K2P93_06095 [Alphaproteobacteria bacterium]|nr:hypothetical protein [Alphaproteobacteria bacterium]
MSGIKKTIFPMAVLGTRLFPMTKTSPLYGLEFEGHRFDCGSKKGYTAATLRLPSEKQEVNSEMLKHEGAL